MIFLFIRNTNMTYIVIGRETCSFCKAALRLLQDKRLPFEFHDISEYDKKSLLWKKKPKTHLTIPVIFHNNKYIGGYKELLQLEI